MAAACVMLSSRESNVSGGVTCVAICLIGSSIAHLSMGGGKASSWHKGLFLQKSILISRKQKISLQRNLKRGLLSRRTIIDAAYQASRHGVNAHEKCWRVIFAISISVSRRPAEECPVAGFIGAGRPESLAAHSSCIYIRGAKNCSDVARKQYLCVLKVSSLSRPWRCYCAQCSIEISAYNAANGSEIEQISKGG